MPASAARVTASITFPRMSGRRIVGVGVPMSSKAIVSCIAGFSNAESGSDWLGVSSAALIASPRPGTWVERLGRVDHPGSQRKPLKAETIAVRHQQRRGAFVDFEDETGSAHLPISLRRQRPARPGHDRLAWCVPTYTSSAPSAGSGSTPPAMRHLRGAVRCARSVPTPDRGCAPRFPEQASGRVPPPGAEPARPRRSSRCRQCGGGSGPGDPVGGGRRVRPNQRAVDRLGPLAGSRATGWQHARRQ